MGHFPTHPPIDNLVYLYLHYPFAWTFMRYRPIASYWSASDYYTAAVSVAPLLPQASHPRHLPRGSPYRKDHPHRRPHHCHTENRQNPFGWWLHPKTVHLHSRVFLITSFSSLFPSSPFAFPTSTCFSGSPLSRTRVLLFFSIAWNRRISSIFKIVC